MHYIIYKIYAALSLFQRLGAMGDNEADLEEAVEACVQQRRDAKVR